MIARAAKRKAHISGQDRERTSRSRASPRHGAVIHNRLQFTLGCIVLGAGIGFYYLYRTTPIALFEYAGIQPATVPVAQDLAHYLSGSIPSFIHVLSLSLLLGSLIRPGYLNYLRVCLFWLLIDSMFEVAQAYGAKIVAVLPEWMRAASMFGAIHDYLRFGAYDTLDISAIIIGACLAYGMLLLTGMQAGSESD